MKKRITIRDLAKLMRVTTEAIRYYEKRNVIKPERDSENGYRSFSWKDVDALETYRRYQELGFSINEVNDMVANNKKEGIYWLLERKKEEAEAEIRKERLRIKRIEEFFEAIELYEHYNGKYYIMDSLHCYSCCYMRNGTTDRKALDDEFWDKLSEHGNYFIRFMSFDIRNIDGGLSGEGDAEFGYSIRYENAEKIGLKKSECISELLPRRCLYTVMLSEEMVTREEFEPIIRWINRAELKIDGRVEVRILATIYESSKAKNILEVRVPIVEKDSPGTQSVPQAHLLGNS